MVGGVLKQYDTESDVDQPGASSGSKPEDTQLTVEQAKEVFTKGRRSKFVPTEAEMQALLNRVFTSDDKLQLDQLDVTVLRKIAKHKGIQISTNSGYIAKGALISAITLP